MTRRILLVFAALVIIAIGLAFYALQLRRKVARDEQLAAQQQIAIAPPANGPSTPVTLYVASDNNGALTKTEMNAVLPAERSERDRSILRGLLELYLQPQTSHPIGAGADIRDVYVMGDDTAIVDTNSAFADAHPSGVLAEELTVASIVTTLNANDARIAKVKILVNGQERETLAGHADLRRFYLASNVGQATKDVP
ncbi:MAG: GerMN domain-containing protein [Acidobacteriota bacterium]|nr:GerMN domain-containing protein [Acidobacteriota bacterium]